jgi:hypothetical protein
MRYLLTTAVFVVFTVGAPAIIVGDTQPGLERYTIDDSADYLGPILNIQTYLDAGKVVVTSHWKQS